MRTAKTHAELDLAEEINCNLKGNRRKKGKAARGRREGRNEMNLMS